MDKALGGILGAVIVGYLVIMAIAAVVIVAAMISATVAAIFVSTFTLSSLYSFNHKTLTMDDHWRTAQISYAVHAVFLMILTLVITGFGYNHFGWDVLWTTLWPFTVIVTFEDGLFGLVENSYAVAASFFFTCLVVSYAVTYRKFVFAKYDDPVSRSRMYRSGLAYFFAIMLIPAYFLGNYAINFVSARSITDANVHSAYKQSKTTPKRATQFSYVLRDQGKRRRLVSVKPDVYRHGRDIVQNLEFYAASQSGKWAFTTEQYSNGARFHYFFNYATGRREIVALKYLDSAVAGDTLEVYWGPYDKAAILYNPSSPANMTLIDLETFRQDTYNLGKERYDIDWSHPSWLVNDISASIPARPLHPLEYDITIRIYRHNDVTVIAPVRVAD